MPETKLKPLYMGKSLEDLKRFYNIGESIKGRKVKALCTSADKLFGEAAKYRLFGDEELGYINYMKYLTIVTMVQGLEEYKKEKAYFNHLLGPQNVSFAMDVAEELAGSLHRRYELMNEQQKIEVEQLAQEEREAKEELKRKQVKLERPSEDTNLVNGTSGASDISISSRQLYSLLQEKETNILILDSRPAACYDKSHMTIGNCINVPEEIVKPGISAAALEKVLPPESRLSWSQRKDADLIVLLDWFTSEKSHQPGTNLYTLKNILIRWDPGIIYKSTPLILEGGYEDWLLTYPMHTTYPEVKAPVHPGLPDDDLLEGVEYPSLVESAEPVVDRTSKPHFVRKGSLLADNVSTMRVATLDSVSEGHQRVISSSTDRMNSNVRPGVNRAAKASALQTYEERSGEATKLLLARGLENKSQEPEDSNKVKTQKEQELLRITKEKEAEELQDINEELLLNVTKVEERQQIEEPEKRLFKEQLEEYRQSEEEAAEEAQSQKEKVMTLPLQETNQTRMLTNFMLMMKAPAERQRMKDAEKARKLEEDKRKEKEQDKQEHEKGNNGTYYTQLRSGDMSSSTSAMKRSHSSPNIAQMMDDTDVGVKNKVPQFDRTIKPLQKPQPSEIKAARQRNFSPVYGSVGHGLTGLKNLGNSCYMNSVIQCINNTTPLAFYFCEGGYREDVNHHNNSTQGEVAEEVAAVVRALWSGQYRSIACRDLKGVVGQHRKQFQGYEQQDSHEFLTILMDWLHEDLNKRSRKLPLRETSNENLSQADQAWNKFRRCSESLIRSLFSGQQRSTVRCCKCHEESVTYEAFSDLSLPLPSSSNKCSLDECLKLYLNCEKISGWNCPSCKEKRDAIKKFDIWKLPPILVIHLNRFYHDGWWRKRQTCVDFPFTMDLHHFTPVPNQRYLVYNLYGVSNHYGTMEGGHYTAYCKNTVYNKWYKFDDHEVSEISLKDVRSGAAYILFYAAVEYKVPGSNS